MDPTHCWVSYDSKANDAHLLLVSESVYGETGWISNTESGEDLMSEWVRNIS